MMTDDDYNSDPDFFVEVDEFMAALPCDEKRVERIGAWLPDSFDEVLLARNKEVVRVAQPVRVFPVVLASIGIAAALLAILAIVLMDHEVEIPQAKKVVPPRPGEMEFVVTIAPDKEPEIVAKPVRVSPPVAAARLEKKIAEMRERMAEYDQPAEVANLPEVDWYERAPTRVAAPEVGDTDWPLGVIDRFVLADLEAEGIGPGDEADWSTRLRRLSFDLTGLPPSRELIERFQHDQSRGAYAAVVDELMATWQFGEHWGARWLDSVGYEAGREDTGEWRFREYVVKAFNDDKRFDVFLKEQLAGEEMRSDDWSQRGERLIATGFLGHVGKWSREGLGSELAGRVFGMDGTLAPAVGSGESLVGKLAFAELERVFGKGELISGHPLILDRKRYPVDNQVTNETAREESKRLRAQLANAERREARALERGDVAQLQRLRDGIGKISETLYRLELGERDRITSTGMFYYGKMVSPRSGDLGLVEKLVDGSHPLTARALVNRVWGELFGRGLVDVASGDSEYDRRELLDTLAVGFVEDGWSVKSLVRNMVSSRTYQRRRSTPRGLDARELTDAVHSAAGWLERAPADAGRARMFARGEFAPIEGLQDGRGFRSIYLKRPRLEMDEGQIFEAAMSAAQLSVASTSSDEWRIRDAFVGVLGRSPIAEEFSWARGVIERGESLGGGGGVLVASARPEDGGERAAELEALLPRITLDGQGGELVSWAALFHALMMTDEFRQVR